ncbi:MAG: enolase C-terminal domain-like protein [Pseudomonadota bacterium]
MKRVRVRAVSVPLKRPIVSKVGLFDRWPVVLIDLEMDDGVIGTSYLEPYLHNAARYVAPAIHDLVDAFKERPIGHAAFFDQARKSLSLIGLEGVSMIAVSGIDMALWDAAAKRAELPLAEFLGGTLGGVKAYNSGGLWLSDPDGQGDEAKALVAEGGFQGLKLRLGRDRLTDDLRALDEVRSGIGEDVNLMVDFNQGLSLDRAIHLCQALDDAGLYWFEEPIPYEQIAGFKELRRRLKTPIQIGENFYGPGIAADAILRSACDFIMPDMMRIGGVTGWLRTAAIASAQGVPMSTHLYPEISAHLMRVTPTAHWLEWQDWADPIVAHPFTLEDSEIQIPDRPGIGISWNEDAVKDFLYEI